MELKVLVDERVKMQFSSCIRNLGSVGMLEVINDESKDAG